MNDDAAWHWAAAAAAEVLNLHFDSDQPKCVLFQKIQHTIYCAMQMAISERVRKAVKQGNN